MNMAAWHHPSVGQSGPLQYVPVAALGVVLVKAAMSLVDLVGLKKLFRIDRTEFALSLVATLGVVAMGAIRAILFCVVLALVRFAWYHDPR